MKKELPPIEFVRYDATRIHKSKAQILADEKVEREKKLAIEKFSQKFDDEKSVKAEDNVKEDVDVEPELVKPKNSRPKKVQDNV